jgi:hypothetical protein
VKLSVKSIQWPRDYTNDDKNPNKYVEKILFTFILVIMTVTFSMVCIKHLLIYFSAKYRKPH